MKHPCRQCDIFNETGTNTGPQCAGCRVPEDFSKGLEPMTHSVPVAMTDYGHRLASGDALRPPDRALNAAELRKEIERIVAGACRVHGANVERMQAGSMGKAEKAARGPIILALVDLGLSHAVIGRHTGIQGRSVTTRLQLMRQEQGRVLRVDLTAHQTLYREIIAEARQRFMAPQDVVIMALKHVRQTGERVSGE